MLVGVAGSNPAQQCQLLSAHHEPELFTKAVLTKALKTKGTSWSAERSEITRQDTLRKNEFIWFHWERTWVKRGKKEVKQGYLCVLSFLLLPLLSSTLRLSFFILQLQHSFQNAPHHFVSLALTFSSLFPTSFWSQVVKEYSLLSSWQQHKWDKLKQNTAFKSKHYDEMYHLSYNLFRFLTWYWFLFLFLPWQQYASIHVCPMNE